MHTYILPTIIILLVLASSFSELPNSIFVEARKLAVSNDHAFKVDLILRDSPHSPYYNSSMTPQERLRRSPLGAISRGHKIHLSSAYYDTNDAKLSELIPNGGDYLIKISLGTPQVEYIATADTGSDLIWVQCTPCDSCIPQKSPPFDLTKSSTFHIIPCTSLACDYPDLTSGCLLSSSTNNESSPCVYRSAYGDGTQSIGILATETLSMPSLDATSMSLPSSVFGCGISQQGDLGNEGEGIIGLGTGPSSLISQLGPKINYKFSYCLAPLSSGVNSKLTFGGDVTGPGVVSTPFKTAASPTFYFLSLDGISIGDNDNAVLVPVSQEVVIDSGTTLTYLPTNVYDGIRAALTSAIRLSPVPSPLKDYDLCYNTKSANSSGQFNPPNMVFHFKGADVVLKAINSFRDIGNDVSCLAMMATESNFIFGNIAQVNYEVGYDLQAKLVSFAPADCTNY